MTPMTLAAALTVPLILAGTAVWALFKGVNVYSALTDGAADGLKTVWKILPALAAILPAIYMLRASGALDALTWALTPLLSALGIPPETVPLMLVRPLSGSGALGVGAELISAYGPDSRVGRTAAVMLGSTETTFYAIAVYFGAAGVKKTRWTIPAAVTADLVGFAAAALTVRWLYD
jgi:spore maturation protein B